MNGATPAVSLTSSVRFSTQSDVIKEDGTANTSIAYIAGVDAAQK